MNPSVTIGIPVYNEEKYISETIISAINQTYDNLKIIISDNCSTDNTFELINRVIANHENVTLIKQEKNIGAVENFNYLSEIANSDFFCWLGGHDILHKDFITSAVKIFIENQGLSLVYPKSEIIDENGRSMNIYSDSDIDTTSLEGIRGPLKVIYNLYYCTAVYGLFKTNIIKEYKFKPIVGSDLVLLYHASVSGKIFELPHIYYFRREVRKETVPETYQRYDGFGIKYRIANPYAEMCKEHLRYTLFSKKIRLIPKIKLMFELAIVLKSRFSSPYMHSVIRIYSIIKRIKNKITRMLLPQKKAI
jgi:glycosyltransferase involved in cell wall biosynthesis